MVFSQKAQGGLDYLLLVGGAVIFAAIVGSLLLGVGSTGGEQASSSTIGYQCSQQASLDGTYDCDGSGGRVVEFKGTNYLCGGVYPKCNIASDDPIQVEQAVANVWCYEHYAVPTYNCLYDPSHQYYLESSVRCAGSAGVYLCHGQASESSCLAFWQDCD